MKAKKVSLENRDIPHPAQARTRVRTVVARNTVDVGTHDIIVQRPRYPTAEEKEIWPDTDVVIDIIHISFPRDTDRLRNEHNYTVKASVCHDSTG
jgi:hypothetical protein